MDFSGALKKQMKTLNCRTADLAYSSSLSISAISKYSSGIRVPSADSAALVQLIDGLEKIAENRKIAFDRQKVYEELALYCTPENDDYDFDRIIDNLNAIVDALNINKSDFAQYTNYDVSFVSRFLSKERKPADTNSFMTSAIQYLLDRYSDPQSLSVLSELMDENLLELDKKFLKETLNLWIASNLTIHKKNARQLLQDIDSFDLSSYTNKNLLQAATSIGQIFNFSTCKVYKDVEGFKKAVLDFIKISLLSGNKEEIFVYDDVPVEEIIGNHNEYFNELILGTNIILKTGIHLNVVHVLDDRPMQENILGIRFWIPLIMSGQVQTKYYERKDPNEDHHVLFVSGNCALAGSFSNQHRTKGEFMLVRNKQLLPVYRQNAKLILENSKPLVLFYDKENNDEFCQFCDEQIQQCGKIQMVLSGPYVSLADDSLVEEILKENGVDTSRPHIKHLVDYIAIRKQQMLKRLQTEKVNMSLLLLDEKEFETYPVMFSPIGFIGERPLQYSYKLYRKHIQQIEEISKQFPNLHLTLLKEHELRNIQIVFKDDKWVALSRTTWPQVHFVVYHPALCKAINQGVSFQQNNK